MPLTPGARVGPYEIVCPVGAGGMGEVYRARDARLGRDVAIKVLPESFANDPARRARFEREARAVAALSHPNIVNIFDIGVSDGHPFVVIELLDGETLRDRLTGGALPVRKAVEIGVQIARGLAAAHAAQVVHRDLKPENVFVLRDGQVKILDFGLARQTDAAETAAATPTIAATDPGVVIGTAGYMAPEQIRAQAVDGRADLFAFGAVLYEMLSGRRAFHRETAAETMTAILKEDPPEVSGSRAEISPALDRIVHHCLEKNPAERFQTARDVAFALEAFSGAKTASGALAALPARQGRRPLAAAIAAAALVALTIVAVRWLWPTPATPLWTGVRLGGPEVALSPSVSPSGDTLAFLAMDRSVTQVAAMKPESGDWTILTHTRNVGPVAHLSWAPDGNTIYFDRYNGVPAGVFSVPALGGDERPVLEDAMCPTALADGSLLVVRRRAERAYGLFRFWPDSARLQTLPIEPAGSLPQAARALPGGAQAAILGTDLSQTPTQGVHLHLVELASGHVRRLPTGVDDSLIVSFTVARDGQSILAGVRSGNLVRVVVIPMSGQGGKATALSFMSESETELDVAPDGSIYATESKQTFPIVRFAAGGGHAEKIAFLPDVVRQLDGAAAAMLPDGRVAVVAIHRGHPRLMIVEAGKEPRALIQTREDTAGPVTLVGAHDVAFTIGPGPRQTIALADVTSGRIARRVPFDKGRIRSLAASPDGQVLYVGAGGTIWSIPSSGGGEPRKIRAGDSAAIDSSGQRLVVQVNETPKARMFEVPLNGGAEREVPLNGPYVITDMALNSSSMSVDGHLLFPLASPDSWFFMPGIVNLATGTMTPIPVDHAGDYWMLLRAPDGHIVAGAFEDRSVLWRFQPEPAKK